MFIKKGNRVYSDVYGMGTAITDESEIFGSIVKFDKENEHLFSAKDAYSIVDRELEDFMFTTIELKLYANMLKFDSLWAKKNYGVCRLKGNNPKQKLYSFENIEVKMFNKDKDSYKNTFKNSQFDASKDFVDKVIKDKKKAETTTIKDFAKEKENSMDNLSSYDATLKKQENKNKPCKNESCACNNKNKDNKNKDNKSCDNNVKYIFVSKDSKELIYGNKEEVADFLWNIKDADEVINETDDIEDFDVYKITGNVEKVPLKKTVKFSI